MTDASQESGVPCGCCGAAKDPEDVARLGRHPEIAVCGGCVHVMAGQLANRPSITPILPVHDMPAAREFWTLAGMHVEEYSPQYALVRYGDAAILHLDLRAELDPERNAAAVYIHVPDPHDWHRRLAAQGLPVSDVVVEPWGMLEFTVPDPSGNRIRVGRHD